MASVRMNRQIWTLRKAGSLRRLVQTEDSLKAPGQGELTIAVRAVGLNFADVFACLGLYSATPQGRFTPGLEFSGTVEAAPESDRKPAFQVGERVMGVTRFGAYASRLNANAAYLLPQPADWSFEQGASFPVQTLTAWYALHQLGAVRPGATVLVHSAAGGVGLRTLELLRTMPARAIGTVGSPGKIDFLKKEYELDPRQIIQRDRRRFGRQLDTALSSLGQSGFDLVLDSIAGPYFWPGFERLHPGGRLVLFGSAHFMPKGQRPNYLKLAFQYATRPRIDPLNMISENRSVMAFNLIWLWDRLDLLTQGLEGLRDLLVRPPYVGRVFDFEAAPAALRFLQSGRSVGKVVLRLDTPAH